MKIIAGYMGLITLVFNLLSCQGSNSSFKPGILSKAGYYIQNDKVYYYGGFGNATVTALENAVAAQFETLEKRFPEQPFAHLYATDGNHVYFEGKLINGADGKTFQVFGYGWAKDSQHVFAFHSILSDDPVHFVNVNGGLFKDRKHVYDGYRIVSDDPAHLTYLGSTNLRSYHADGRGVFTGSIRIDPADAETFKPLMHNYSMDAKAVFLIDEGMPLMLEGADPATFKVLSRYYAKDEKNVFWRNYKLPDADPSTFQITSEEHHEGRDQWRRYLQYAVIGSDSTK
ncbi:DKNYY domain-containing protein [Dyadobacter sp. Leaf189]|uniref:DKNYY domain-containing protein n=1 Tax=Dyadobacter sp. Leaf189 TaxID=1736295 RepID=UPI00138ECAB6|nr:DKNYY domain-containing protein [Dyadobacter sp. Leaf189]